MAMKPSSKFSSMNAKSPAKSNYMADWKSKRSALDNEGDKYNSSTPSSVKSDWLKRSNALDSEGDKLMTTGKPFRGVKPGPNRNARIAALKGKLK